MGLIGHVILEKFAPSGVNPEPIYKSGTPKGNLYNYVWAKNGVFLIAENGRLSVAFPVAQFETCGMEMECKTVFAMSMPKVPLHKTVEMLGQADHYAEKYLETLFHFVWSPVNPFDEGWEMIVPEQERSLYACCQMKTDSPNSSHHRATLEVHSHHRMPANFSPDDDRDETGFRLYGVVGRLGSELPEIRMRVGVYGQFWEIPASWVMELPQGIYDCVAG
jgi:hypothetical protein